MESPEAPQQPQRRFRFRFPRPRAWVSACNCRSEGTRSSAARNKLKVRGGSGMSASVRVVRTARNGAGRAKTLVK